MSDARLFGFTPDGRRRYVAEYDLPPIAGGADPTMDDQVDASSDDATEIESDGAINFFWWIVDITASDLVASRRWGGLRFHNGPFPAQGSTIDVAYLEVYVSSDSYDDARFDIHAEDAAGGGTFTTSTYNVTTRTRTTAFAAWLQTSLGVGWKQSPSLVSVIQEIVTDYILTSIVLILKPRTDVYSRFVVRTWDETSHVLGAKLHLEWTEGGVTTLTPSPVALPLTTPAPTLVAGAVTLAASPAAIVTDVPLITLVRTATLSPAPVGLPLTVVEPSVSAGALVVQATPVAAPLVVPAPSISLGSVTLAPAPVAMPLAVPNVVIVTEGTLAAQPVAITVVVPSPSLLSQEVLTPDPVSLLLAVPEPALVIGTATLAPSPVVLPLLVPDPQMATICTIAPAPVTLPLVVPTPGLASGSYVIAVEPVVATWVVAVPSLVGVGAPGFVQFGNLTRLITRSDYPASALFYFEAVLASGSPAYTARTRLYNITDGIVLAGSELSTTSTTPVRLRSGALTLPAGSKEYRGELGGDAGGVYTCYAADVIVDSG